MTAKAGGRVEMVRASQRALGGFEAGVRGVDDYAKLLGLDHCWNGIAISHELGSGCAEFGRRIRALSGHTNEEVAYMSLDSKERSGLELSSWKSVTLR